MMTLLAAAIFFIAATSLFGAEPGRKILSGHVPRVLTGLTPKGRLPATNQLVLAIGLPLRNQAALGELLRQLYDPHSTNFHKFLSPPEFTARFGPTEQDYQAVIKFAEANGLAVVRKHPNRLVLDVEGSVSNIEQAFQITLRTYRHPTEPRDFFAPDTEPSVPVNLSVVTVEGLSDYELPRPLLHKIDSSKVHPLGGSGPGGYYAGNDFRNAYVPGTTLNGAGQSVGVLEFSSYYQVDITNYEKTNGLANYVSLTNEVVGSPAPGTANNIEVALDIEMAIAMASGLSRVIVYETSGSASSILSQMADDNLAKQMSCSWTWSGGPSATVDSILLQMAAQGQSFFQAAGDKDAYTGRQTLDNANQTTAPVDSTNLTCVGGTSLMMNGSGVSWLSEAVWNYSTNGGSDANVGSGGGISTYYTIPYWQTNVSMTANSGSTTFRNIPDVALTADQVYVAYDDGSSGGVAGTSCAAPLWAGFCALVNQQSVAAGGTTVGFLNPALYAIASGTNYNACFHDITTGNNIGRNTPGLFYAVTNYDLATGLGTPNGINLINALAPSLLPYFQSQPSSQTVTNGASVTFSSTVSGSTPLSYQWLFNGVSLVNGSGISGATSNVLTLTAVTTNSSGNYSLFVTNDFGSKTSSVAVLTVGFAPAFSAQPTNLVILSGSNALFSAMVGGSTPLSYQWLFDGTNLANGSGISGATSNVLMLTAVTTNKNGSYSLFVTNDFGAKTSSVAVLTVGFAPAFSAQPTNLVIVSGSNALFSAMVGGSTPLSYQWLFNGANLVNGSGISGATSNVLTLTGVTTNNSGNYDLFVTNGFGTNTSSVATLTVGFAPAVSVQPTNLVILSGSNALFSSTVNGSTPLSYQWLVNGTNLVNGSGISGATSNILTLTAVTTNNSGNYSLFVTNNFGSKTSSVAVLTVGFAPVFSVQPTNLVVLSGSNALFSAMVGGSIPLSYKWLVNGTNLVNGPGISGATSNVLTLTAVTTNNSGNYDLFVANDFGTSTSSVATLTVVIPPPIITSVTANNDGSITLNFSGAPDYAYVLESTTNLNSPANWMPLATNMLATNGLWQFTDTQATNFPQQFYRLELLP
jgi:hypothetical protein